MTARSIDWQVGSPYSDRYTHHLGPQQPNIEAQKVHAGGTEGRRQMQFGVQFFPAVDHNDKSAADYYAESLAIAEEADTLGFSHLRTVEHYFTRYGGYSPNPIVFLTAMSQRTKRVRLVTGAVCRCSIIRSSSRARSPCSTASRAAGSTWASRARSCRTSFGASASPRRIECTFP